MTHKVVSSLSNPSLAGLVLKAPDKSDNEHKHNPSPGEHAPNSSLSPDALEVALVGVFWVLIFLTFSPNLSKRLSRELIGLAMESLQRPSRGSPCLFRALEAQGLDQERLGRLMSLITVVNFPRRELGNLCLLLKIRIELCWLQNKNRKDQRAKYCLSRYIYPISQSANQDWPLYKIGIILNHYFSFDYQCGLSPRIPRLFLATRPNSKNVPHAALGQRSNQWRTDGVSMSSFDLFKGLS